MKETILLLAIAIVCSCSVKLGAGGDNLSAANQTAQTNAAHPGTTTDAPQAAAKSSVPNCTGFQSTGKKLITKQSFPFDHEPFKGSCFVTFASKEEMVDDTDVPRGSTFYIYQDGKEVYQFPDAFGGLSGCWVEAVAFDDLNDDARIDVIVAGKCLGAKDSYSMNAVYRNNGRAFTTDQDANSKLEELDSIKKIVNFVRKNRSDFF